MKPQLALILAGGLLLQACSTTTTSPRASLAHERVDSAAADEFHLGSHEFPITTNSPEAQAAFNRGINLTYAFSHGAAEKEFRRAAALDPDAAMPWWGVALVNGPHINFPLVPEHKAEIAWDALTRARALTANASPLERELISALAVRYVENQPEDRSALDRAYADAMREVWRRHQDNSDIGTLYAEALMDLHPWDLWNSDGTPKEWTPEILAALEQTLTVNRLHPGANHLYIHAVEASNAPERGVPSADRLRTLVPGASHLLHMPAHIYVRVARWEDAAIANERAVRADVEFRKAHPRPGFFAMYMAHNHHFLSFVRMMQGRREDALIAAREMLRLVPEDFIEEFGPVADGYMAIALEVLMRFGRWEEVLAEPAPDERFPFARSMWRYTRVAALTALDRKEEAKRERTLFDSAVRQVPKDATFGNNQAHALLEIARLVLDGEMAARAGNFAPAIKSLESAAALEDQLKYDEPPDWIQPVRHTLGITLLRAGKPEAAERAYREDLNRFPANGWSLYGLSRALEAQGKDQEAQQIRREFESEWANADTQITSSCLCQSGV